MTLLTILGDSLAVRRNEAGIEEINTYGYLIQESLPGVFVMNKARRNTSSDDLAGLASRVYDIDGGHSSYFVIQVGIVDCSPRIFSQKFRQLLDALSGYSLLKTPINFYIAMKSRKRFRLTKKKRIAYVDKVAYEKNLRSVISHIKETNPAKRIFLINIVNPNAYIQEISFGIGELIETYNGCLARIAAGTDGVELVDINTFTKENPGSVLPDGQHITAAAHRYIADTIIGSIKKAGGNAS